MVLSRVQIKLYIITWTTSFSKDLTSIKLTESKTYYQAGRHDRHNNLRLRLYPKYPAEKLIFEKIGHRIPGVTKLVHRPVI